ncbi:MAG TPA: ABC transporter substrate-binding protein, partial [bacterium]|nr:ABC transporter substrate-binding protein [bacterium]
MGTRVGSALVASSLALAVAFFTPAHPAAGAPSGPALTIDQGSDAATLDPALQYDPASYDVYRNIFDNLLTRDPGTGRIAAGVAKSWKSLTPTTWEFTLQPGIKFQNGDPLTAADVAFSISRILDPVLKSPQYQNFSAIQSVKVLNPTAVQITTAQPYPALLAQLVNLSIVPANYVKQKGNAEFNAHPVGSGPYEFVTWVKGDTITLRASPSYWRGRPFFDTVRFRAVPEPATQLADLQAGTADLIVSVNPDSVAQIQSNPKLQVLSGPTERVAYLAFNPLGQGPTAKRQVREAIAYALNDREMITALLAGQARKLNGLLTPQHAGYDPRLPGFAYDPSKAKALLVEAGYPSGVSLTFTTSPQYDQRIVQAIQGELARVGVQVKLQSYDFATYLHKVQSPQHDWGDIRFGQWSCACLDADGV